MILTSWASGEGRSPDTEDAADDLSGKEPVFDLEHRFKSKKECAEPMKKSYLIAVIAALAAVAGALAAVAIYLRRREKELDEYERLLFGEDDAETTEETTAEEAPAEEAAAPADEAAAE